MGRSLGSGEGSEGAVSGLLVSQEPGRPPSVSPLRSTSARGESPPTVWMETILGLVSGGMEGVWEGEMRHYLLWESIAPIHVSGGSWC